MTQEGRKGNGEGSLEGRKESLRRWHLISARIMERNDPNKPSNAADKERASANG